MKAIVRAVGYRRVSMREQVDGFSLDAQEDNIRKYAEDRGWQLEEIYTDAGISAKRNSKRPALERLMQSTEKGAFDVVIVDKIDRFYRHLNGLLTALNILKDRNVSFVSVQERLDFTTPWGKLTLTVLGMLAEIYIDNLRNETKKGKIQRAKDGFWNGSIPYGYCKGLCAQCKDRNGEGYCPEFGTTDKSSGKVLIVHPVDGPIVQQAYSLYAEGGYSDLRVAEKLNSHTIILKNGVRVQPRQKGIKGRKDPGPFSKDFVRGLLLNIFYTGKIPYYGPNNKRQPQAIYPGKHPGLVDEQLFEKVQEMRRLGAGGRRKSNGKEIRLYPLSGLIRCADCGWPMRGTSEGVKENSRRYYRDASQIDRSGICSARLARADIVETQLADILRRKLDAWHNKYRPDLAEKVIAESNERIQRSKILFMHGELSLEEFEAISKREKSTQETLCDSQYGATMTHAKELLDKWNSALPIDKKRQFRLILETVWVQDNAIVAVQPTATFLPLMSAPEKSRSNCKCGLDGI